MAVEIIKVRKKNNPTVTRSIKKSALSTFQKRGWESVEPIQITTTTPEVKKKDVEPAEVPAGEVAETPFAPVESEENSTDAMREEYQTLSGKAADKRWSEKRLIEEIVKLK